MLRKINSLKKRFEFLSVFENGKVFWGEFLILKFLPNNFGVRLGISISRKYGSAVSRNRFKRLVRVAFRSCDTFEGDYVIIPRKRKTNDFKDIYEDIFKLISECTNFYQH